jgi:hypothetical protein
MLVVIYMILGDIGSSSSYPIFLLGVEMIGSSKFHGADILFDDGFNQICIGAYYKL